MQKRSLSKVFLYSFLSLGVYELVWLSQTRKELTKLTNIRIPSVRWLVLLNALQFAGIVVGIVLAILLIGAKSTPVSPACWSEYALSVAPETAGEVHLSTACRSQIELSNAASSRQGKLIKGYLVVVGLLFVSWFGYPRWLRNYALAVQQVTGGKLSQTNAMFMLVLARPYGMVAAQDALNKADVPNQDALLVAQPSENKTAHKVLSVLALIMAILFGLFILFLVAISYYGTH